MSRRGWILFGLMCVIWGIPYLLIRVAVRDISPTGVVFARTAIASLLLIPVALWRKQLAGLAAYRPWLALYTVVEVLLPWLLLTRAEQHLSSSLSGLLIAAVPLVSLILNRVIGDTSERLDATRLTGLAVGLAGVAALVGIQFGEVSGVAVLETMGVAIGYATGPIILSRRLSAAPALGVVVVSLAATAVFYAPFAATTWPQSVATKSLLSVIALGVVCTAAAFVVFVALIAEVGPSHQTAADRRTGRITRRSCPS